MIVEFVGCTGAGKSTLIADLRQRLAAGASVTTPFELAAGPLARHGKSHVTVRNLLQEGAALPLFLAALPHQRAFLAFALRMLARQAALSIFTLNNLRSLIRKSGMHELSRRRQRGRIILVDEGPVLMAHILFVYSQASYSEAEIAAFARLVPLPDLLVYVRAPEATLLRRSLQRADPPREMRSAAAQERAAYIRKAVALFDMLARDERIRNRLLTVDNPDGRDGSREAIAERIAREMLARQPHLPNQESAEPSAHVS